MATRRYPCGTTKDIKTHIVGGCEIYKEKQGAPDRGIRKSDESR